MEPVLTEDAAFGGLVILDYLLDLFTMSAREAFARVDILHVLNVVKNDPSLFAPDTVLAFDQMTEKLEDICNL